MDEKMKEVVNYGDARHLKILPVLVNSGSLDR